MAALFFIQADAGTGGEKHVFLECQLFHVAAAITRCYSMGLMPRVILRSTALFSAHGEMCHKARYPLPEVKRGRSALSAGSQAQAKDGDTGEKRRKSHVLCQ
ncbi:hypothetical protein GCWU000341_00849 [Oribacterium sp. oral taxon 078 str. F0262]|nr:hypothetical protein GCWU000341_00849 [Oribacterium sp. oral taxon 078 str. F0262]